MNHDTWHELTSRSSLLAVGVSLCFIAIMLRGFVRSNRRVIALRKQHLLHVRKLDDSTHAANTPPALTHAEKHLPRYAQATLIVGLVITVLSFFQN